MDGNDLQKLEIRVRTLEQDKKTERAVEVERQKAQDKNWADVDKRLSRLEVLVTRAIGLLVLGIASAFINFVLQGGLNIASG